MLSTGVSPVPERGRGQARVALLSWAEGWLDVLLDFVDFVSDIGTDHFVGDFLGRDA